MKVILVENILSDKIVGIYSTLEKAKIATIKGEQELLKDDTLPKELANEIRQEIENAKKVNEIEKLNDIFMDEFWLREIEVDK